MKLIAYLNHDTDDVTATHLNDIERSNSESESTPPASNNPTGKRIEAIFEIKSIKGDRLCI